VYRQLWSMKRLQVQGSVTQLTITVHRSNTSISQCTCKHKPKSGSPQFWLDDKWHKTDIAFVCTYCVILNQVKKKDGPL